MLIAVTGGRSVSESISTVSESSRITDPVYNLASAMGAESIKTHKNVPNKKYFPNRGGNTTIPPDPTITEIQLILVKLLGRSDRYSNQNLGKEWRLLRNEMPSPPVFEKY